MQAAVLGPVSAFEATATISTASLGQALAQCLAAGGVVLMRRHGVATVAASVRDAFVQAIYLEENASGPQWPSRKKSVAAISCLASAG